MSELRERAPANGSGELSDAKRALLERWRRSGGADARQRIPLRPRDDWFPLSSAQRRIWIVEEIHPESAFNGSLALRLRVAVDVERVRWALCELVRRHEVFSVQFAVRDGAPMQRVGPPRPVPLRTVDLRALPEHERGERLRSEARADAERKFDIVLERPLLRGTLLLCTPEESTLVVTAHMICFDAPSARVFAEEFAALYAGREGPLPSAPIGYLDYAAWESEQLASPAARRGVEFWRDELSNLAAPLELATDRPRPAVQRFDARRIHFEVASPVAQRLQALGRAEGVSLFVVLLSAFQLLLRRYGDSEDFCVGTWVAQREGATERLVGPLVNTLALRTRIDSSASFRELLRHGGERVRRAMAQRTTPFEWVVEALSPPRDASRHPIFQVNFVLQDVVKRDAVDFVELSELDGEVSASVGYDLELIVRPDGDRLFGILEYATALFDAETARRMADGFAQLLDAVANEPDRATRDVATTPAARSAAPRGRDVSLAWLARPLPHAGPDAPALEDDRRAWSAGELELDVAAIAAGLTGMGVVAETPVAIVLGRGADFWRAALAVLRAGGAFVPVDPALPAARQEFLLSDSRARLCIVADAVESALPRGPWAVATLAALSAARACAVATPAPATGDAAYVLYTSGSTGTPKGVVIERAALAHHVAAMGAALALGPGDVALQLASPSFDVALEEALATLAFGGAVRVVGAGWLDSISDLVAGIETARASILNLPTALFHALADELARGSVALPSSVRCILVGGEAPDPAAFARVRSRLGPGVRLFNAYGLTETTITNFLYEWPSHDGVASDRVPIGTPLPGVSARVIDRDGGLRPDGAAGELALAGPWLARGYLGDEARTRERFLVDDTGTRWFRSGDRVRVRPGGQLEFLGRMDDQVKIRGFRVELGEVESALRSVGGVGDAAVLATRGPSGLRLEAWFAARRPGEIGAGALRDALGSVLPSYMVPSRFHELESLPLTPTGKIDRARLARSSPVDERRDAGARDEAHSERESVLLAIWSRLLGRSDLGADENFFEQGADSILVIQAVARTREAGWRVGARQIFEHPSVRALARVLEPATESAVSQAPVLGETPLAPMQARYLRDEVDPQHGNLALAFDCAVPLEASVLAAAAADVVRHHDALRNGFRKHEGAWRQECAAADGVPRVESRDLRGLPPEAQDERIREALADLQSGFQLESGCLLALAHFRRGGGVPDLLVAVAHHLVCDGVSFRVLLEDLSSAYLARLAGRSPCLPQKTVSFQEWARSALAWLRAGSLDAEVAFWEEQARAATSTLNGDGRAERPRGAVGRERCIATELSLEATACLVEGSGRAFGVDVMDALAAAVSLALRERTGAQRIRIDVERHGRETPWADVDLGRTVGWFTALHPCTLDLRGAHDLGAVLKQVKQQLRCIPHGGVGYGLLRYLHPDAAVRARLERLGDPDLCLNYLGQIDRGSAGGELVVSDRDSGPRESARRSRDHVLLVEARIARGVLRVEWFHDLETHGDMRRLADATAAHLESIVAFCAAAGAAPTPSDFPEARLDQHALDGLVARFA